MDRLIFIAILLFTSTSSNASNSLEGVWQPSRAFLGAMAWNKNYLIIKDENFIIENESAVKEEYTYKIESSSMGEVFLLESGNYWWFEHNPKYACTKKSITRYDPDCTMHDQRKVFTLHQCADPNDKNSCTILDAYFKFEDSEVEKLTKSSPNL